MRTKPTLSEGAAAMTAADPPITLLTTARFNLTPEDAVSLLISGEFEVLVTAYADDTGEAALRFGHHNTAAVWSPPVALEVAP